MKCLLPLFEYKSLLKPMILATAMLTIQFSYAFDELIEIEVPPKKSHEECLNLLTTSNLHYDFNASSPINFNIHYHQNGKTIYPVKEYGVTKNSHASYKPTASITYCMMWVNIENKAVTVNYYFKDSNPTN
ncbi:MAG: hypothetical protein KUG82_16570 [Pseudomonadales bacterium]|nr:hypothetical protein [Pseudomonadales bacterium]